MFRGPPPLICIICGCLLKPERRHPGRDRRKGAGASGGRRAVSDRRNEASFPSAP